MGRTPCCDKNGLKKGPWTPEEDLKLSNYIQVHGAGNWRNLPKNAGLQRCGKSCRLRWTNYLRPDIKRGRFSFEEEETIIQLHSVLGNKWSAIAGRLPGRTDNEIKNYWNTHIRKRLMRNGIDPITHAQRLDLFDLSNILNVSNLLGAQALLNPRLLSLAITFSTLKQQNPDLQQNQLTCINYQQNLAPNLQPSQLQIQAPIQSQTEQLMQATGEIYSSELMTNCGYQFSRENLAGSSDPVVQFVSENSEFQSMDGSHNFSFDSVRSTPISSPAPLNSSSTFINRSTSTTADDEIERFSSWLEFEVPESLDINDFFVNI